MTGVMQAGDNDRATREYEHGLLRQQEVFRQILDAIADMVLVKGKDSRILWANKAFRDYYGMSNEQLREIVDAPFNSPDSTQQYIRDDLQVFSTGLTLEVPEEVVTRHDGLAQHFNTIKAAIRDETGHVRMTVGVSRNITETKRIREDSQRYREQLERDRLAAFAAQLPGFLFQYRVRADGSEHMPFVSARVLEYYDVGPDALANDAAPLFANVCAEDRPAVTLLFRAAAASMSAVHSHHRVMGRDGVTRWMELVAQPSRAPDGTVLFNGYVHDISARRNVEVERELLIAELCERNAAMEQFTYAISHDLKSPLVTIRTYLSAIEEDMRHGNHTRALTDLGRVRAAADKMARMQADLLELSRIGRVKPDLREVAVDEVLREACELLAGPIHAASVRVSVNTAGARVRADRGRALQIFQNLLDNAVKCLGNQPQPCIDISCKTDNGFTVTSVRDNGIGIAKAHFERIFGLFEKLDPRAEGTGVGLALVRGIVEAHGGSIWVASDGPGTGAVFHVRLPAWTDGNREQR
jgi:PAS domain S-box-containing protein